MDASVHEILKRKAEVVNYRKRRLLGFAKLLLAASLLCYFDVRTHLAVFFEPGTNFFTAKSTECIVASCAALIAAFLAISGIRDIILHSTAKRSWQVIRVNPLRKYFLGVTHDDDDTLKTETLLSSPTKAPSFSHLVASPSVIFSTGFRNLFVSSPSVQVSSATQSGGVDTKQQSQAKNIPGVSPIPSLKLPPTSPSQPSEVDRFIAAAAITLSCKRPLTRQVSDSLVVGDAGKRQRTVDESSILNNSVLYYSSSSEEIMQVKTPPSRRKKASALKRRLSSGDVSPEVNPYDSGCRTMKRLEVLEDFLERQREQATYDVLANQPLLSLFDADTMAPYCVATRPAAEVSTITTLTSSPMVDEIWLSLHVTNTMLYEWTKRFRNWMSVTVLAPIVVEVNSLNRSFVESNVTDDLRFGHSSISAIRSSFDRFQAAGFSQAVTSRIDMLCRFLDTDLHQSYVVTRIAELARAGYLHGYAWNGPPANVNSASAAPSPVKDAQLLMDLFLNYMDAIQPKNSMFPEGRLFSRRYFVKAPNKPVDPVHNAKHAGSAALSPGHDSSLPMIQIYQPDESIPHFELYLRGKRIQLRRSNNNLFHVLLLFFYVIIKRPQLVEPPARTQRRTVSSSKAESSSGNAATTPSSNAAPSSFETAIANLPALPLLGPLRLDKAGLNLVSLFDVPR